jgi:hypothetical protein
MLMLLLAVAGCASFDREIDRDRSFAQTKHFFVISNLNDNHALDHRIAASLRAHGREAEVGPLTMMPVETQVVVTYQDHWSWDFGDHLSFLKISARDAKSSQPFASITFSTRMPLRQDAGVTVDHMIGELLEK